MKKLSAFIMTILCMGFLLAFSASAQAAGVKSAPVDTGASLSLSQTGVTPANLGASFYARISLEDPELYMTMPSNEMDTVQLKPYVEDSTQYWHFTRQSNGSYKVRNLHSNLYMELYDDDVQEYHEVFFTDPDNLPDQCWYLQKAGNGYQFVTLCDTSFVLKGVSLYGDHAEALISQDRLRETTHFIITKLPFSGDYLSTPQVRLSNILGGVSVEWNAVPYAEKYRVYRYNNSTKKWVALKDTTGTKYVDKSVVSGNTYKYTVKCMTPLLSKYEGKSIKYLAAPTPKVSNTASGTVSISWNVCN